MRRLVALLSALGSIYVWLEDHSVPVHVPPTSPRIIDDIARRVAPEHLGLLPIKLEEGGREVHQRRRVRVMIMASIPVKNSTSRTKAETPQPRGGVRRAAEATASVQAAQPTLRGA